MGIEMARAVEQREGRAEGKGEKNAEKAIDIWKGLLRLQPHPLLRLLLRLLLMLRKNQ